MKFGKLNVKWGDTNVITDSITLKLLETEKKAVNDGFKADLHMPDAQSTQKMNTVINTLRTRAGDRAKRFAEYADVKRDPIIGQAIEMMADDATQFDVDRERTVWLEGAPEDKDYCDAVNGIIQDYIEPFIDTMASNIVSKGEFAYRVNTSNEKRGNYKDVVLVPFKKVENLAHIISPDNNHYFYEVKRGANTNDDKIKENDFQEFTKFLHFINYSIDNSDEQEVKMKNGEVNSLFILQGESILTEKILETYRIVKTLENSLIKFRLAKSRVVRFVNVNVSRITDNAKAQQIVNYVHSAVASQDNVSGTNYVGTDISTDPVVLTVPVNGEVGKITIEEFSTSADITNVADLDHFMDKLFAGLRTPKQFFEYGDTGINGGLSGTAMTKVDVRYARAVKKVQRVIVNGIKDLIEIFDKLNNIEKPKTVKIKILKVASPEDSDRYTEYEARLQTALNFAASIMDPNTGAVNVKMVEVLTKFFTDVMPIDEVKNYLNGLQTKVNVKAAPGGVLKNAINKKTE